MRESIYTLGSLLAEFRDLAQLLCLYLNARDIARLRLANYQLHENSVLSKHQEAKGLARVTAGGRHRLYNTIDGKVYACGRNRNGQLGLGHTEDVKTPHEIPLFADKFVVEIAAGANHTVFRTRDGKVYAVGDNHYGQLGLGNWDDIYTPQELTFFAHRKVTGIAAAGRHTLFKTEKGKVFSVGDNSFGQLGLGHFSDINSPEEILFSDENVVVELAAGESHNLFRSQDNKVFGVGYNCLVQYTFANPSIYSINIPQELHFLEGNIVVAIAAHGDVSQFKFSNGEIRQTLFFGGFRGVKVINFLQGPQCLFPNKPETFDDSTTKRLISLLAHALPKRYCQNLDLPSTEGLGFFTAFRGDRVNILFKLLTREHPISLEDFHTLIQHQIALYESKNHNKIQLPESVSEDDKRTLEQAIKFSNFKGINGYYDLLIKLNEIISARLASKKNRAPSAGCEPCSADPLVMPGWGSL